MPSLLSDKINVFLLSFFCLHVLMVLTTFVVKMYTGTRCGSKPSFTQLLTFSPFTYELHLVDGLRMCMIRKKKKEMIKSRVRSFFFLDAPVASSLNFQTLVWKDLHCWTLELAEPNPNAFRQVLKAFYHSLMRFRCIWKISQCLKLSLKGGSEWKWGETKLVEENMSSNVNGEWKGSNDV